MRNIKARIYLIGKDFSRNLSGEAALRLSRLKWTLLFVATAGAAAAFWCADGVFYARMAAIEAWPRGKPADDTDRIKSCPRCNVVLVVLDTFRADHLGVLSGGPSLTPNLDAIARQGLVFTNAYANAYFTTPSHLTLLTSLYPQTHQVSNRSGANLRAAGSKFIQYTLEENQTTLAQEMKSSGYSTHASAPKDLRYLEAGLGLYRGFDSVVEPVFKRAVLRDDPQKGFDIGRWNAIEKRLKAPFFLFVHSFLAHMPYVADDLQPQTEIPLERVRLRNEYMNSKFRIRLNEKDQEGTGPDALAHSIGAYQQRLIEKSGGGDFVAAAYASNVRDLDEQLGKFWQEARKLENTIFIFVSDHGEQLFEHGKAGHTTFHEHTLRVPWFMTGPGVPAGRSDKLVSLIDVMPTVLSLTGQKPPPGIQGKSVVGTEPAESVFGHTLGQDFIRTGNWKLFINKFGQSELYYLPLDPGERKNLAGSSNWLVIRAKRDLEEKLDRWRLATALQ